MPRNSDNDNHSNQLNPNSDAYWKSRGEDGRPEEWAAQSGQAEDTQD